MHEKALNNCSLKGSRHEIAQPCTSPWPLELTECQTSISPADALASIPCVHGVWGALSILLRRKALAAAYSLVIVFWGMGFAPQRSPGDSGIWEGQVRVCFLQLPYGSKVSRPVSPPIGEFIQGLPVGTGCKLLLREDGATGKPSDIAALLQTPCQPLLAIEMQRSHLPFAWDGGLFPGAVMLH